MQLYDPTASGPQPGRLRHLVECAVTPIVQQQQPAISGHQHIAESVVVEVRSGNSVAVISGDRGSHCHRDIRELPIAVIPINRLWPAKHLADGPDFLAVVPATGKAQIQITVIIKIEQSDPAPQRFQNRNLARLGPIAIRELHAGTICDFLKSNVG